MSIAQPELVDRFEQFFQDYYHEDIAKLAQRYPEDQRSLEVDWRDLYRFDRDIAENYLAQPDQLREYAEEALRLHDIPVDVSLGQAHVRIHHLPKRTPLSDIRSRDVNTLIKVRGTTKSISARRSRPREAAFECHRCGTLTYISQPTTIRKRRDVKEPYECQGCERQGPFSVNFAQSSFVDQQTLLLQEELTELGDDDSIESLIVEVEEDLTGQVRPGDHLVVTGVLRLEELGGSNDGSLSDNRLDAHSIQTVSVNEFIDLTDSEKRKIVELSSRDDIFEQFVESVAPTVFGHGEAKKAIVLQLFSGVEKPLSSGPDIRGDIHILLVGDPGTGKSILLRRGATLAPRAVQASGKETTKPGLTVSATPSGKGQGSDPWFLEGGVMVLANGGIACIDDFTNLPTDAMDALHGVLEHQEINSSKATQTKSLKAKTSVLAAGNPRYGRFDQYEPIAEQIEVDPALISQFDIVLAVTDNPDEERDRKLSEHILITNREGELQAATGKSDSQAQTSDPPIPRADFRKYVAYARQNCNPIIDDPAKEKIREFYVDMRSRASDEDAPLPITARKLEGIIRLAEASARARLSGTVEAVDAERAISLVRTTLQDIGVDPETGQLNADVIKTGTSNSQRDRIESIRTILEEIQDDYDEGAPVEEVLARAAEIGIDESKAEHEIEKLRQRGEVYEPFEDHLRTT